MWIFKIFRLPNLFIVALTIWVIGQHIIYPNFISFDIPISLSNKDVYVLIFLAICISAGGYLHNDILDYKTDLNNNKRAYINDTIKRQLAYIIYFSILIIPLPFAYSLACEIQHPEYIWIYISVSALLFFYNRYLKRTVLIGNLIIALLCAGIVLLMLLAEQDGLLLLKELSSHNYYKILNICLFYSGFAFFTNLNREIVKDVIDIEGDISEGYHTLPIHCGLMKTKQLVIIIQFLIIILILAWLMQSGWHTGSMILTALILLIAPAIYITLYIFKIHSVDGYRLLSHLYKGWMLAGLLFLILI